MRDASFVSGAQQPRRRRGTAGAAFRRRGASSGALGSAVRSPRDPRPCRRTPHKALDALPVPRSRYRRFLAPTSTLSEGPLRYLVEIDHRNHEALIALDEQRNEGVGVARYVRDAARPSAAAVAVTVVDDWQGRGLGTLLLEGITMRAREAGVDTFTAQMLAGNRQMMDLLERLGGVRVADRAAGTVAVEVHLPAIGVTPELRTLIRLAAASDIAYRLASYLAVTAGVPARADANHTHLVTTATSSARRPDGGA